MKNTRSFTIVEMLISISIFAIIMITLHSAFQSGIFGFKQIEESGVISQNAYIILNRLDRDLRNSFAYSAQDAKFSGQKNSLSFFTLTPDFAFVNYSFGSNKIFRLARINQNSLNEVSEIKPKVLASNVKQMEFHYLDIDPITGVLKENDIWNNSTSFPAAVKVNFVLGDSQEFIFSRLIYLTAGK